MVWFAYKTDVPLGWAVHTVNGWIDPQNIKDIGQL